ncbi:MAG: AAA family ATPase [Dorea sp.]|nr:AAA family ATPase [Dorea sp.]
MYCILVTGIPAAGKTTMAEYLSERMHLPVFSKDTVKELLYDHVGFHSRKEKVNLGIAGMEMIYYAAKQLMKVGQPFILENNFEHISKAGITALLEEYRYPALTVTLTGDYMAVHQRFLERNISPARHKGHVLNDCYPEEREHSLEELKAASLSFEDYLQGIESRGFDTFCVGGKQIVIDTTDFSKVDMDRYWHRSWNGAQAR